MKEFKFILLGIFFTLFLYHLLVYMGRKKDFKNFFYSLYCLSLSFLLFSTQILPDLNLILYKKYEPFIRPFSCHIVAGTITFFSYIIFNLKNNKLIKKIVLFSYLFLSLILLIVFFSKIMYNAININYFYFPFLSLHGCIFILLIITRFIFEKQYKNRTVSIIVSGFSILLLFLIVQAFLNIFGIRSFIITYLFFSINSFFFAFALTDSFNQEYKELLDIKNSLEQKVIDRTKQLEEAHRQKTTFFINLTHETKTPLTLITNYLDKHINKHGTTQEIKIVQQNVNKLQHDVINFLDTEKLERGQIIYNHDKIINLSNIVSVKAMMFKEVANKKNINITTKIDEKTYIKIDLSAIDRIINNLIDNATKYTPENGKINIILTSNSDDVELIVSDTGIGISIEDQRHIFEPYYQITHEKRNIQGMGMGLHIVKEIIDEINAKLEIESELNKGTSFKITFKKYYLKEGEKVQKNIDYSKPIDNISTIKLKEKPYDEKRQNIFIIEDNLELLDYIQSELHGMFNVFIAENGQKALEKIDSIQKPDLIISDIMMDQIDGYEFCKRVKQIDKYKNIPFIFLTAKTTNKDKKWGYIKGADDYITKPFNITELYLKIEKILERKSKVIKDLNKDKEENIKNKYKKYRITKQEQKIIDLVKQGKENKEIAGELNISESTVKNHLRSIFNKTRAKTRTELLKLIFSLSKKNISQ